MGVSPLSAFVLKLLVNILILVVVWGMFQKHLREQDFNGHGSLEA